MIRLRSAFLIVLLAVLLAFAAGVQAGYLASRVSALTVGMERWTDEMKSDAAKFREADVSP
jgi:hypothetical protein